MINLVFLISLNLNYDFWSAKVIKYIKQNKLKNYIFKIEEKSYASPGVPPKFMGK
jgi:hypothetical protein